MAKDKYHDTVRSALENDGWTITHDPLVIPLEDGAFKVDLGAEKLIAAERLEQKIAVEVKSLLRISQSTDLHLAIGQCINYKEALIEADMDRTVCLAIPLRGYIRMKKTPFYLRTLLKYGIQLIVVDTKSETITEWIK